MFQRNGLGRDWLCFDCLGGEIEACIMRANKRLRPDQVSPCKKSNSLKANDHFGGRQMSVG